MQPEADALARVISAETGLTFVATSGTDRDGHRWYLLRLQALPSDHAFGIRTTIG